MRDFRLWATDDQRSADVDIGVVVDQLWACVGACCARQTRIQRDTIVLIVPRIVDDVEFIATVEESNWACIVTQVTAGALVHLEFITTGHGAQNHEHNGAKGQAWNEHCIG